MKNSTPLLPVRDFRTLSAFVLVVLCFSLWGFANDITNPMVKAFGRIYGLSNVRSSLVQMAFYGGYFVMALPAALLNRRAGYRAGILIGLALFSAGNLLFFPGVKVGDYATFLLAYFVMTCGLSFLETSANPLVLSMGDRGSATFRLNFAQAFNPIGSLLGIWVSIKAVQERLSPLSTSERLSLPEAEAEATLAHDLSVLSQPYVYLGLVLIVVFVLFYFVGKGVQLQKEATEELPPLRDTFRALFRDRVYTRGVVAQFFYVGAQIMCWTFIIQYGVRIFTGMGFTEAESEILAQKYNLAAMFLFCISRFLGTAFLRKIRPYKMLAALSVLALVLIAVTIFSPSVYGLVSLVAVSGCMSIMFPTIYALALKNTGVHTPIGAAGLVMAILGGSLLPVVQAAVIDLPVSGSLSSVNLSFIVPFISFVVILGYALFSRHHHALSCA